MCAFAVVIVAQQFADQIPLQLVNSVPNIAFRVILVLAKYNYIIVILIHSAKSKSEFFQFKKKNDFVIKSTYKIFLLKFNFILSCNDWAK